MSDDFKPKLSASTIFMMLLEAKKEGNAKSQRLNGEPNPTTDVGVLYRLLKILFPSTTPMGDSTMSDASTCLKNGTNRKSTFTMLHDKTHNFEGVTRFNKSPDKALAECKAFFKACISSDDLKIEILGRRLLEIVYLDDSISDDVVLKILPNCNKIKKSDIKNTRSYKIEYLLLGLWLYVIENNIIKDDAQTAFNEWYGEPDSSGVCHFKNLFFGTDFNECSITLLSESDRTIEIGENDNAIKNTAAPLYDFSTYLKNLKLKNSMPKTFRYKEGERLFEEYYVINDLRFLQNNSTLKNDEVTAENIGVRFNRYTVIAGNGGQGKSMMMRHLLLNAIDNFSSTNVIPIFVCLNDIKKKSPYIDDLVYEAIVEMETLEGISQHINRETEFYPLLLSGKFVFLFDGLDEVEKDKRIEFKKQINKFTEKYSSNQFIISSRSCGNDSFFNLDKYKTAFVEPLSKPQAIDMVDKLDNITDIDYVKKFKERLEDELYDKHPDFASNPLLLTIMLNTYSTVGEIKDNPYDFYKDAYLALSREHDAKKNWEREFHTGATGDRLGEYLQEICTLSLIDGKRRITRNEFEDYFRSARQILKRDSETFDFEPFIKDLMDSLCIVAMDGSDYVFIHNAFQDYFCTRYFENLEPDQLHKIPDFYDEDAVLHDTGVLDMLYDKKQEKFERYMIIPYLSKLFDKCDREDGFITFIKEIFPNLKIAEGRINDEDYVLEPSKPFYDFIVKKAAGIIPVRQIDISKCHEEIVTETYGFKLVKRNFESFVPLAESDDITNPTGHLMEISAEELFNSQDKYGDIIDAIKDRDSYLLDEYNELKDYFSDIQEKAKSISEKRSTLFNRRK